MFAGPSPQLTYRIWEKVREQQQGSDRHTILSMILREATTLLIAGLAVGTFLALITASVARALVFGMQPNDPVTT